MFNFNIIFQYILTNVLWSIPSIYLFYKLFKRIILSRNNNSFKDIPGPLTQSWFTGNLAQLFNPKGLSYHLDLVDKYGGMIKVYGFFGDEQLYISDPKALNAVILKEQDAFEETELFLETNKAIFGPGLVSTKGHQHKLQRKLTVPIFATHHLRKIVSTLYNIADKLGDVMSLEIQAQVQPLKSKTVDTNSNIYDNIRTNGNTSINDKASSINIKTVDMSDWMSRFALESIGRTVLGYSFDSLDSKEINPYTSAIKELIPTIFSLSVLRQLAPFLITLGPTWFRKKLVDLAPIEAVQKLKKMSDVMYLKAKEILDEKRVQLRYSGGEEEKEGVNGEGEGRLRDIISSLIKASDSAPDNERMSENELIGQMTVLIFGAQDTTSSTLSRILWKLSYRPDIQSKIRKELELLRMKKNDYINGGDDDEADAEKEEKKGKERFTYDELMELPWLDAVIKETLRMYPPIPFVRRVATRDCTIPYTSTTFPASNSNSNSQTHVHIPKGTTLFVSIAGSNRLESVWGYDAKEWKPERWVSNDSEEEGKREKREEKREKLPGIYAGMMSFLGGNRSCVGYRFAQIEMKIMLSVLLTKFTFEPSHEDEIVWNLSQIIAPAVRSVEGDEGESGEGKEKKKKVVVERKGLPLKVGFVSAQ